jgi:hypothetical protein
MHGGAVTLPSRATCVVWHAKRSTAPSDLIAALRRPGFDRVDCDSAFAVIAQIGLLRRSAPTAPIVLLLVDPVRLAPQIAGLLAVLERIAPNLILWAFAGGASPSIRQVSSDELLGTRSAAAAPSPLGSPVTIAPRYQQPAPLKLAVTEEIVSSVDPASSDSRIDLPVAAAARAPAATALRISDDGSEYQSKSDQREGQAGMSLAQSSKTLLSDEELAMLLADDAENSGA